MKNMEKTDKNQLINMKVFKLIRENTTKELKMRWKTHKIIKSVKITEVTFKQIATQEFKEKKEKYKFKNK